MTRYEYKVVPAPAKGIKGKGARSPQDRFALALQTMMNTFGADGWHYVRADTLPATQRSGLTGTATVSQHVLVFQRPISAENAAPRDAAPPLLLTRKARNQPSAPDGSDASINAAFTLQDPLPHTNGSEDSGDVTHISTALQSLAKHRLQNGQG